MGFSRQEYWSGLPVPSPGDLPELPTILNLIKTKRVQGKYPPFQPSISIIKYSNSLLYMDEITTRKEY